MSIKVTPATYREFDAFCRARDRLYYGYGQAFTRDPRQSTDCSGLVLQSAAFLGGRTDWVGNRYGSTESFRLDYDIVYKLGFKRMPRGGAPIDALMLVGLQHGGGGEYSHTACTVRGNDRPGGAVAFSSRGVDWESMGDGVRYYDGARAWNDPLFHDFWYLDAVLGDVAPPRPVINEIDAEYKRAASWLGRRLDGRELPLPDREGRMVRCEHGVIYWHPKVRANKAVGDRAVAVPGDVMDVWRRVNYETGPLGYPIERHYTDPGTGTIQAFQGGAVYRKFGTDGGVMTGKILQRYASEKAEKSRLGYPLGDEQFHDGGRSQKFEHGTAVFHPSMVVEILDAPTA
ncbi:hypothetical protein OG579_17165 [Williamsia herbipolensis]|uniref:Lysin A n=1 Tax=Williamsia herbipolensis TaxID=1603258 RepID=A0AAU4K022_9NOCA|nr:hypothetical protein [Williamsia herbipolensis]